MLTLFSGDYGIDEFMCLARYAGAYQHEQCSKCKSTGCHRCSHSKVVRDLNALAAHCIRKAEEAKSAHC